jgi:hypothetical protein
VGDFASLDSAGDLTVTGTVAATGAVLGQLQINSPNALTNGLTCFGDSITYGDDANPLTLGYCNLLGYDIGGVFTNYGNPGDAAADTSITKVYPLTNPVVNGPLYTIMDGTNDSFQYGTNTDKQANYSNIMAGNIGWLAIQRTAKLFGQDAGITKTGTWTADNTLQAGLGIKSSTNGNTVSFSITTTGGPVYIGYLMTDGNGGTASVNVDGVSAGTFQDYGQNNALIATSHGTTSGVGLFRYPVAAGTHSVVVTVTSATGAGNVVTVEWAGTPIASGPTVAVGGIIDQYLNAVPANLTYNNLVQVVATQLASDGLDVRFAPTRNYVNNTTDMDPASFAHPLNSGHEHLRDAFAFALELRSSAHTLQSFNATNGGSSSTSFSPSSLVVSSGNHTVVATDGIIYLNGSAANLTLPTSGIPIGLQIEVMNFSPTTASTISGAQHNFGSSLPSYCGYTLQYLQTGSWWAIGSYGCVLYGGLTPNVSTSDGTGTQAVTLAPGGTIAVAEVPIIPATNGGMGIDTSALTGCPSDVAGVWSIVTCTSSNVNNTPINSAGLGYFISTGITSAGAAVYVSAAVGPAPQSVDTCQFYLAEPFAIGHAAIHIQTGVAASTVTAGIYNSSKTKLIDTGTFSGAVSADVSNSFTPVTLPAGWYYMAWSASTQTTLTAFVLDQGPGNAFNSTSAKCGYAQNSATSGVLPSALGTITPDSHQPLYVIWEY